MKVILSAAICVMLTAAVPLFAEDPTTPDPPSREQVVRFLDLMQVRARLVQVTDSMKKNMKAGAEAGLRQRLPNPTPEQIEKVDGFADAVFQDYLERPGILHAEARADEHAQRRDEHDDQQHHHGHQQDHAHVNPGRHL